MKKIKFAVLLAAILFTPILSAAQITRAITISQAVRAGGTYQFQTAVGVPADLRFARFQVVLDLADKLAVGKTLSLKFFFSPDGGASWVFANGTSWTSYGPGGLTVTDPDGTVHVNPDPTLVVPLSTKIGQRVRGEFVLGQSTNAGMIIDLAQ